MAEREYFAARSTDEIGKFLIGRLESSMNFFRDGGREDYQNAYMHYFGREMGYGITSGVTRGGNQGELAAIRVNHSRSLAKAFISLVTSARVTWRPMARNSDVTAAASVALAHRILEDLWKNKQLSQVHYRWVESATVFSEAYVFPEWDMSAGPAVLGPGGKITKAGDIVFHNIPPWDVFKDGRRKSYGELDWKFFRIQKNRFDLAALTPSLATGEEGDEAKDRILSAIDSDAMRGLEYSDMAGDDPDAAPLWFFVHKPTATLPKGRLTIFLADNCVLADLPLLSAYPEDPLYRLAFDEVAGTPDAWCQYWDTLGAQEVIDSLETSIATNQTTLATQCIAIEQGSEQAPQDAAAGMRVWTYPRGATAPQAVQLVKTPPEVFQHRKELIGDQRNIMGLNDVALGQPQTAQMNAQAFAVLASMAVQQASPFQQKATDALGNLGGGVLRLFRMRVTEERSVQITGQTSKHLYSEEKYTGTKLEPVERVIVDVGNPLEQTAQGRLSILQNMMEMGLIKTPEEFQQVVETGRLEPAVRALADELRLIHSEYEDLSRGENPPVHYLQNHLLHYKENASVLLNPEALRNPMVIRAVEEHLAAHYLEQYGVDQKTDPMFFVRVRLLLGQTPPEPMGPPEIGQEGTGEAPSMPGEPGIQMGASPPPVLNPMTGAPLSMTQPPIA